MQWSLENIYKKQVRGKIPPRRHLHVLGEASYEEVAAMMAKLNKDGLLQPDNELEYIKRYLTKRPLEGGVKKYLLSKNITDTTLEDKNAPDAIVDILHQNGDLQTYLNYISEEPMTFTREVRSGATGQYAYVGNLIDKMKRASGLKEETLNDLLVLKGTEGSRGVGMGELAMATIFSDVSMRTGAGDLTWNNQYLEVKGSGARLGGDFSGKPYQGFEHTALGKLTAPLNINVPDGTDVAKLVNGLAEMEEIDQKDLMQALMEFAKKHYPDNTIDIASGINLSHYESVREALQLAYASDYANKHNVEWYIMINTVLGQKAFGQYYLFRPSSLQQYIKTGLPFNIGAIKLNDLGPALLTIGAAKFAKK
tara:strand:+ start:54 stop:1151 length:1098 start_codon:yes stop_codon:yes gene_type:complete